MTQTEAQVPKTGPFWRSRRVILAGIVTMVLVVLIRLGLTTYWSIEGSGEHISISRLVLVWVLALVVLAMLSRFAWQISTGKHR
jgi:hypothetical protein